MYLIDKLQRVQNTAAHLVTRTRKFDSITLVLKQLHSSPVKQRIYYKMLLLTYKALNGMSPQYISGLLTQCKPARNLRSSNKLLLQIQCYRLKTYGYRLFQVAAPILWNSLPLTIKKSILSPYLNRVLKRSSSTTTTIFLSTLVLQLISTKF